MTNKEAIEYLNSMKSDPVDYGELVGAPSPYLGIHYVHIEPEDYAIDLAIKALEQQDNEKWVPVSERLPERDINSFGDTLSHSKEVLVVVKYDNYEESGEQYIAWFDNNEYDMYIEALKTGECDDSVVPEKEAWHVYNKGVHAYEDLYKKSVIAWKPMPEEYKGE